MRSLLILAVASILAACTTTPTPPATAPTWRSVATAQDRERLSNWRDAFVKALARARAAGHGAEIAAEGALLEPDAALGGTLPNGNYRCRVTKIGARSEGLLEYIAYPAFRCLVSPNGAIQTFSKLTGSQRPVGSIYPADATRQVFLGTLVLGDETQVMRYGSDPDRDVAAWVERIGPDRWRMVFPSPRYESLTDVVELVPAS